MCVNRSLAIKHSLREMGTETLCYSMKWSLLIHILNALINMKWYFFSFKFVHTKGSWDRSVPIGKA